MNKPDKIMTINDLDHIDFSSFEKEYKYQEKLTKELDSLKGEFTQETINKIVLWKVNRYALMEEMTLELLNEIPSKGEVDKNLSRKVLQKLLSTRGIRLAMASSILRFKNPNWFQIIDQRVYRFITGKEMKVSQVLEEQIDLYFDYLNKLRKISKKMEVEFIKVDRIFYEMDKKYNQNIKIKY